MSEYTGFDRLPRDLKNRIQKNIYTLIQEFDIDYRSMTVEFGINQLTDIYKREYGKISNQIILKEVNSIIKLGHLELIEKGTGRVKSKYKIVNKKYKKRENSELNNSEEWKDPYDGY